MVDPETALHIPLEYSSFDDKSFILRVMNPDKRRRYAGTIRFLSFLMAALLVMLAGHLYLYGQDQSDFPDGYDAVEAAPDSHKVIFENALVRVLEPDRAAAGQNHTDAPPSICQVFFWTGIPVEVRRTFAITARMAAFRSMPAQPSQFMPGYGTFSG
jgi:hypothetical protein